MHRSAPKKLTDALKSLFQVLLSSLCLLRLRLRILHLLTFFCMMAGGSENNCGGFVNVDTKRSLSFIKTPNYPNGYPEYIRCKWILEAPAEHQVLLTVDFEGERGENGCTDSVEFWDGGFDTKGLLIITTCDPMITKNVTSSGRWMSVFFHSDGFNSSRGLYAVHQAIYVGSSINNSILQPYGTCKSYEFACSNMICLSRSYLCDGYYDCGCGEGCDESDCLGTGYDVYTQIIIGVGVGIVLFITVAVLSVALEKRHHWKYQKDTMREQRSSRVGRTAGKDKSLSRIEPRVKLTSEDDRNKWQKIGKKTSKSSSRVEPQRKDTGKLFSSVKTLKSSFLSKKPVT